MELIQSYNDSTSSGDSDCDKSLTEKNIRSVYLITYSQADLSKFSSREHFAAAVVKSFKSGTANVLQWCCSREKHKKSGEHYHLALKLDRNQRWLQSKNFLSQEHGIVVHYSSRHDNYYSAWRYVTKEDLHFVQSEGHQDLGNKGEPKTSAASRGKRARAAERESETDARRKKRKLTAFEVSQIIIDNGIKTVIELQALAFEQKKAGKTDLAEFLINRSPRVIADILSTAWEIEQSSAKLECSKKSQIELLEEASNGDCVEGCNGEWLICAKEILRNNSVSIQLFSNAVKELLHKGRGKNRNLLLTGPANCGKSFLLNPLTVIYDTFCNPATGSFAWVGVDSAECIYLNDFRWSNQIIPWHDLLLMLEGHLVHLPAPKTHFAKDICLQRDTPVFSTGKSSLVYLKNGVIDEVETDMMSARWLNIWLHYQIPRAEQREIPACGKCFSQLIINPLATTLELVEYEDIM